MDSSNHEATIAGNDRRMDIKISTEGTVTLEHGWSCTLRTALAGTAAALLVAPVYVWRVADPAGAMELALCAGLAVAGLCNALVTALIACQPEQSWTVSRGCLTITRTGLLATRKIDIGWREVTRVSVLRRTTEDGIPYAQLCFDTVHGPVTTCGHHDAVLLEGVAARCSALLSRAAPEHGVLERQAVTS